jgi:hypothetical protein
MISVESAGGSAGSYSAEITIRSSEGQCSKVEYVLNNTPQTSLIRSNGAEQESIFGTNPLQDGDIVVTKCTHYAEKYPNGVSNAEVEAPALNATGTWATPKDVMNFEFKLKEKGGKISGTGKQFSDYPRGDGTMFTATNRLKVSGKRDGNKLIVTIRDLDVGGTHQETWIQQDQDHIGGFNRIE